MSVSNSNPKDDSNFHLVSIRAASRKLGIPYHLLLNAVKSGTLPSYKPFNSRRFVLLGEIEAHILAHRSGGCR